jgi:type I restriction enzyme S subunit
MIDNVYKEAVHKVALADLVDIRSARKPERVEDHPFDSSLPYMNIKALETGALNQFAEEIGYTMNENDLVVVKDGSRSGKVFRAQEGIAASTMAILSARSEKVQMNYLYCYLGYCYDEFQSRLRGTAISHLDMNYLKQLVIPLPDGVRQKEIAEKYQRIESLVNKLEEKSSRLIELSLKLGNSELKKKCEKLNQYGKAMLKAWLHQVFKKVE